MLGIRPPRQTNPRASMSIRSGRTHCLVDRRPSRRRRESQTGRLTDQPSTATAVSPQRALDTFSGSGHRRAWRTPRTATAGPRSAGSPNHADRPELFDEPRDVVDEAGGDAHAVLQVLARAPVERDQVPTRDVMVVVVAPIELLHARGQPARAELENADLQAAVAGEDAIDDEVAQGELDPTDVKGMSSRAATGSWSFSNQAWSNPDARTSLSTTWNNGVTPSSSSATTRARGVRAGDSGRPRPPPRHDVLRREPTIDPATPQGGQGGPTQRLPGHRGWSAARPLGSPALPPPAETGHPASGGSHGSGSGWW